MTAFLIIQHDRAVRPRQGDGRYGALHPVNMDGFYPREADAAEVAEFMAEERPDLETLVVKLVRKVTR